ncbi:MAG: hypothetical protein WAQ08_05890 [Aquabacterium sp.]|uniref:hypothetical protein n=1 Tax=Aquabacterium sp. TaxID=1872578 RepID=UPI003BB106CF
MINAILRALKRLRTPTPATPYEAGRRAYSTPGSKNPHPAGSHEHAEFERGMDDAWADAQI